MDITDFLGITVVGAALSGIMAWVKAHYETEGGVNKLITVGLAIIIGGLYFWLRQTLWWTTILGVLAAASTVYALLIK